MMPENIVFDFDISICIVTLNARDYLRDSLRSIECTLAGLRAEVIVVDNHSNDGTVEMLRQDFPWVRLIENEKNEGFARPTNKALRLAGGRYCLLLNPDTVILDNAIQKLVAFLDEHTEIGICGPKALNRDGSLQKACRRGVSRPWAVLSYFTGLSMLFPRSKLFGGYLLNYMDEDEVHEVDGVSGSCMLIRREVMDQIGLLDDRYFAYQEDADYCFRAKKAGWKIFYMPEAEITHYGGLGGSRVYPYRSIYEWHRSYFLYYRKNLAREYFFLFNWLYYLAMVFKLFLSLLVNMFRTDKFAGPKRG